MGNVLDVTSQVQEWHDIEGCHKHPDASVTEGACCVCDAEDPCEAAEQDAAEWEPEPGDEDCGLCNRPARYCICDEAYEAMKDRELGL